MAHVSKKFKTNTQKEIVTEISELPIEIKSESPVAVKDWKWACAQHGYTFVTKSHPKYKDVRATYDLANPKEPKFVSALSLVPSVDLTSDMTDAELKRHFWKTACHDHKKIFCSKEEPEYKSILDTYIRLMEDHRLSRPFTVLSDSKLSAMNDRELQSYFWNYACFENCGLLDKSQSESGVVCKFPSKADPEYSQVLDLYKTRKGEFEKRCFSQ